MRTFQVTGRINKLQELFINKPGEMGPDGIKPNGIPRNPEVKNALRFTSSRVTPAFYTCLV